MNASEIMIREAHEHERDEILAIHLDAFGADDAIEGKIKCCDALDHQHF